MKKKCIFIWMMVLMLIINIMPTAVLAEITIPEKPEVQTAPSDIENNTEELAAENAVASEEPVQTKDGGAELTILDGAGTDLARGLAIQYKAAANKTEYPDRSEGDDLKLATDGDSATFYTTGKLSAELDTQNNGGQIIPMLELPKETKYNMVRVNYELLGRTASAPSRIRFVYAQNGGATGSYQDLVSESIFNLKSHDQADETFKFPVREEQWLGFHVNSGASGEKNDFEFRIYDWEVYYDGSLLNSVEMPESVMIDSKKESRVKVTARNADGEAMEDLSGYEWKFEAVKGCERVFGDADTGEIVIPSNANTGTYRVTLVHTENPELNASAEIVINPDPDNWEQLFHKIMGAAVIMIPDSGTETVAYQIYTEDGEVMPNQEQITWRLAEEYKGVTMFGSTVMVSPDAEAGAIRLYAVYDGHEIYTDITLEKSRYGKDLAAGKQLKYLATSGESRFTNKTGENLATDRNPETFYTTGTMTSDPENKGGQILPMLTLDRGVKFNVIRVNYELAMTSDAPSRLRLVYSPVGGASSQYVDIVPSDELKTQKYDKFIKIPVREEQYVGFHLNTGTSSTGKWIPELKLYDFEVYYDGNQLNRIEAPDAVRIDREQETRVKVTAYNADGNAMENLSEYQWTGNAQTGCDYVYFDAETGEVVVPPDASLGTYSIALTNTENPELTMSTAIEVSTPLDEMDTYFHHIEGEKQIVIPKNGKMETRYKVCDENGNETKYPSLVSWKLVKSYPGVSLNGQNLMVSNEAEKGTVSLAAVVGGDYQITMDISLVEASQSIGSLISEIEGNKFVVSPYYGEQDVNTVRYQAKAYDGTMIADGVKWSVKAAPPGVTMDENTGVLSVPSNVNDVKVKVLAEKNGIEAEKLVTLVSRYDGGPNLLRLPGVSVNNYASEGTELSYDGNFATKSTTEISSATKSVNITLPRNYYIDTLRVYKDFGGFENSYQTTARINGTAFGGKGWSNSPLEADIWQAGPVPFDSKVLQYTFIPKEHATDIYEMELYSSYIRFDKVVSDKERAEIPGGGSETVQFTALAENGQPVEDITYADGETHTVKWQLITPVDGVSIDEHTGVLTVTPEAQPTTVTVRGIYFGRVRDLAIPIGSSSDFSVLAQMDYDWLTLDKLTHEDPSNITYKMTLYNQAPQGSSITWESSKPAYLTTTGDISFPYTQGDMDIVLTATIRNGSTELKKSFDVTIRTPEEFIDKNIVSDRELFGLWDSEKNMWAVMGKLNYDASAEFAPIEEAVKAMDYEQAKQLLYEITVERLKNTPNSPNIMAAYSSPTTEIYMNSTSLYTTKAANFITVGNNRDWYSTDVLSMIKDSLASTVILHSDMKENVLVEVDSKESEFKPYILVKFKNGNEMKFEAKQDTTIRAGYYAEQNYGSETALRVLDSGYPIDSNTQRAYLGFDLGGISNTGDISSAQLFIHAENMGKTGNKKLDVLYYAGIIWNENEYTWANTKGSMALFSYSGTEGGFEFSYPPGGDPEVLLNQIGRLYHLHNIASGFAATKNERYAYSVFKLLDGFYNHAGENNSYPRGFDGYERNSRFMTAYKHCVDSKYMTPEMTTYFWKHLWELHNQVSISRDPFFNEVDNMMISMTDQTITFLSEFPEFRDTEKWIDIYVSRMLPLLQRVIFPDGSYAESSDSYAESSIMTFASSVEKADRIGVSLGDHFNDLIHKSVYFYGAMHLPDFGLPGYGDSNPTPGKTSDSFMLKMAKLFKDDVLKYMAANGKEGGIKPDNTSFCFTDTNRIYMRSDWTDDALYMMTNIDDSYSSHGHKDELSVTAWAYGDFAITDTGRYNYTWSDPVNVELLSSQNHNTLGRITDLKSGKIYMQAPNGEKDKSQVKNWASSYDFDYFSGNTKESLYFSDTAMKTGYNRKILFVKPDYWIVSDVVQDRSSAGKTDNKYDIMFHLRPGNRHVIDNENKTVKTNFADTTNVQLLSPDADAQITRETGIYAPQSGSYTTTDRIVFSKTKPASEFTTFDTVIYPTRAGELNTGISVERIDMDVPTSVASAMHIIRETQSGAENDYYYYTNENAFQNLNTFAKREFGEFSYDGEAVFVSYDVKNRVEGIELIKGRALTKDGKMIIESAKQIPDLSISFDNDIMKVSSSVQTLQELGNVTVNAGRIVKKVMYNNTPITFSQKDEGIVLGSNTFVIDPEVQNPDGGEPYILLPAIHFGDRFSYGGNSYAVTVEIPEGTKIKPIPGWNGSFKIEVSSAENDEHIAGRIKIKTTDAGNIEFMTPISINVQAHASAKVSLIIDGKSIVQSRKLTNKEPERAELAPKSAGLYILRDNLWIITNECSELVVGEIKIPELPAGGNGGGGGGGNGDPNKKPDDEKPGTENPDPEVPEKKAPFQDLTDVPWAQEAINALYEKGFVNGKEEGIFAPNDPITRAEYTAILVRAFQLTADNTVTGFKDVEKGQWYSEPIGIANALGIVKGISEDSFGINDLITRQDMMVMLYRLMQSMGISLEENRGIEEITDWEAVAEYAKEAMQRMYCAGIINGMGNGTLAPEETARRAEAAKIIYEIFIRTESNEK